MDAEVGLGRSALTMVGQECPSLGNGLGATLCAGRGSHAQDIGGGAQRNRARHEEPDIAERALEQAEHFWP